MKVKTRPQDVAAGDGPPWPLSDGPTVEHFAPDCWVRHHGSEPDSDSDEWLGAMLEARRNWLHFHQLWAQDQGLDDDQARRAYRHRRPRWC